MRIHSALALCVLLGCWNHPAPEGATIENAVNRPYGGYTVVVSRDGGVLRGELLAIDRNGVWVLDAQKRTRSLPLRSIERAEVYKYDYEGLGWWGGLGALSTLSHGFLLIFTLPFWGIAAAAVAGFDADYMRVSYPDDDIKELSMWARYPQGMPGAAMVTPTPPSSNRDQAWQLTKQAQIAARAGRCDEVVKLDARVRTLDKDLYDVTFLRDEAIRRCMQLPSLLPRGDAGVP